jgi:hypothetical protein
MYLLDTSTLELHDFQSNDIPEYAILSHRWSGEEVSFLDLRDGKGPDLAGFSKFKGCCAQAASDGWQYVWIDSCCIDKSSSAELSEAINSMFRWYQNAEVCYAYLVDVPESTEDPRLPDSFFRRSKWFTRGWTLQELLAPSTVVFFDCNWVEIGTKSSLCDTIVSITGIKLLANFEEACVAQKMSWASRRETTRLEDMAYCLMGLFGVNMPPLYGEGENAFRRLQLEILNRMDDESLFAWKEERGGVWPWIVERSGMGGLLARSPTAFRYSGDVQKLTRAKERPSFSMTNKGVRIELRLIPLKDVNFPKGSAPHPKDVTDAFLAPLNCKEKGSANCLALYLKKLGGNSFQRGVRDLIPWVWDMERTTTQLLHVRQDKDNRKPPEIQSQKEFVFLIKCSSLLENGFSISQRHIKEHISFSGKDLWETIDGGLKVTLRFSILNTLGALMFTNGDAIKFVVLFEVDGLAQAGVNILIPKGDRLLEDIVSSFFESKSERGQQLCLDRITKPVGGGLCLSVCLKKRMDKGKKQHVIDISTKT